MDCDRVFMILTRGPFPTGELWDEDVEAHLETCSDCWRLAEALRPALEVFQEAVPPAESRDLPGYWGDARPAASLVAELGRATGWLATTRLATTSGVRRAPLIYTARPNHSLATRVSPEVLRAMVLASTLTATMVGGSLLWLVW